MRIGALAGIVGTMVMVACGGSGDASPTGVNSTGGTAGDGSVTATINGTAWRSSKALDHALRASANAPIITLSATNLPYSIAIAIGPITGPATFSMDVGNPSNAVVTMTAGSLTTIWSTALSGGKGSVTVTTLTATRIAGTFSFDAISNAGAATVQVRNGTFDLAF